MACAPYPSTVLLAKLTILLLYIAFIFGCRICSSLVHVTLFRTFGHLYSSSIVLSFVSCGNVLMSRTTGLYSSSAVSCLVEAIRVYCGIRESAVFYLCFKSQLLLCRRLSVIEYCRGLSTEKQGQVVYPRRSRGLTLGGGGRGPH